jgi:hypothetical protein
MRASFNEQERQGRGRSPRRYSRPPSGDGWLAAEGAGIISDVGRGTSGSLAARASGSRCGGSCGGGR